MTSLHWIRMICLRRGADDAWAETTFTDVPASPTRRPGAPDGGRSACARRSAVTAGAAVPGGAPVDEGGDFSSYNITVWRLVAAGGGAAATPEYIVKQNRTIGELAKEFGSAKDGAAEVGFHAEMLVAQEIYLRSDVRGGRMVVSQVFTERFPCRECQSLLAHYPQFKGAPYYYYLSYTDKTWQKQRAGGSWGRFLMQCYGV